jgi:hypothetical protein
MVRRELVRKWNMAAFFEAVLVRSLIQCYLILGIPKSLHIFLARKLVILSCLVIKIEGFFKCYP